VPTRLCVTHYFILFAGDNLNVIAQRELKINASQESLDVVKTGSDTRDPTHGVHHPCCDRLIPHCLPSAHVHALLYTLSLCVSNNYYNSLQQLNLLYMFWSLEDVRRGARFMLVRTKRPYFQSSVACATGIIDNQTRSRG
jgi:hypothetical protein